MKKSILLMLSFVLLVFAGCSSSDDVLVGDEVLYSSCNDGEYEHGDAFVDDCNTCKCYDGKVLCTEIACENNDVNDSDSSLGFDEFLDDIKFNQDLLDFEKEWLGYLEIKYPQSKIYYMKTKEFNCDECYEVSYKKDRNVIKIKVLNGEKKSETLVFDDIAVEIVDDDICQLFQGSWNDCPKLYTTDEEACDIGCGLPVCEFDYNTIVYNKVGEECGGLDKGDCEYGLVCFYVSRDNKYGICKE